MRGFLRKERIFTLRFVSPLTSLRKSQGPSPCGGNEKILPLPLGTRRFCGWLIPAGERAVKQQQKETVMGYDIFGNKPTAPEGEYYRRNIWRWPPFVAMCRRLAPRESKRCKDWEFNVGRGLNAVDALRLANRLDELLADGTIAAYIEDCGEPAVTALQAEALRLVKGLTKAHGSAAVSTPGLAAPAVTEKDVREFIAFLKTCGGFRIF